MSFRSWICVATLVGLVGCRAPQVNGIPDGGDADVTTADVAPHDGAMVDATPGDSTTLYAHSLPLRVRETSGIARIDEVARSGVPLPATLGVTDPAQLGVVDPRGQAVPAQFRVLARWNAGVDESTAPIQWVLVMFVASVDASSTAVYRLVTDGAAGVVPAPIHRLALTQSGGQVTVDTGVAVFQLGGNPEALFDQIRLADGTIVSSGGAMTARANGASSSHRTQRRVYIENQGPVSAAIVVEGAYDLPAVGGGGIGSRRRYLFSAGSGTAIVRHAVAWEGTRCPGDRGALACGGSPNALLVEQVRDTFDLQLPAPWNATAVGAYDDAATTSMLASGTPASVRQRLRATRTSPRAFDVQVGVERQSGVAADGGMLALSSAGHTLTVALGHMHRYEPQALRLLADGRVAVDLADDTAWIAHHQGLFATLAVSAMPSAATRAEMNRLVWAPLNRPLRGWPEADTFAASQAVDEIPVGTLPADLAGYDPLVRSVLDRTLTKVDEKGLNGLMTFGLYPRSWGSTQHADELTCVDPTPASSWDDLFWCGTFTDYHNTVATAPIWAMRSGDVQYLDEIAVPGALRSLHTQIMQCAPGDSWSYCGQAPTGYGAYRSDDNGSHAYFDNLFLYYWQTGDSMVTDTLTRGAGSMRRYFCSRRPAAPCLPQDPPTDVWAGQVDRVASQWAAAFRFVGLASDAGFLADYQSVLARAATQYYVESQRGGAAYGFWSADVVGGAGSHTTTALWMASLYDMNNVFRLQRDTGDTAIGIPAIRPSRILAAWARTLSAFGAADGTAEGRWPNQLDFSFSGARIGGTLVSATPSFTGSDPMLWDTGKANLVAVLVRAAQQEHDPALLAMGVAMTHVTLAAATADDSPLGKVQGLYLSRLHAAVARLAAP